MKKIAALIAIVAIGASLVGCSSETREGVWQLRAEGEIVEIEDGSGIFVTGYIKGGIRHINGETKSENLIDYKYAYVEDDGAIKQGFISNLWNSLTHQGMGYDASAHRNVSIYEDVAEGEMPHIEVLSCQDTPYESDLEKPFDIEYLFSTYECVRPWGGTSHPGQLLVNIHVPKGTVMNVDRLNTSPQTTNSEEKE